MKETVQNCPAERALQAIGGRWKVFILHQLFRQTLRFAQLQRGINNVDIANTDAPNTGTRTAAVTPKMLAQELRQLEADGLVLRTVYAQVPPKVEYSLTPLGRSLRPVMDALAEWGRRLQHEAEGTNSPCAAEERSVSL